MNMNNQAAAATLATDIETGGHKVELDAPVDVEARGSDIGTAPQTAHVSQPQLCKSISIIQKGQIQIGKLTFDSPLLVKLLPTRADRELIISVLGKIDANKDGEYRVSATLLRVRCVSVSNTKISLYLFLQNISFFCYHLLSSWWCLVGVIIGAIDYEELVQLLASLCEQLKEKEGAEFEKKLAQKTAKSQRNLIFGLCACLAVTLASTFASSFASAFLAKDTTISSNGNLFLNKRNMQPISTSIAEIKYELFEAAEDTPAYKLGCIGGHQIKALATGSLSQPVILTDPNGGVHKIDGHDLKFYDDGGVIIKETSGRIIEIKKDATCAASTEGRRLQQLFHAVDSFSFNDITAACGENNFYWDNVHQDMYGSSSNPDVTEIKCLDWIDIDWASGP